MKLCIDPGHGPRDNPSPADGRYVEGARMFDLQEFLRPELERYGFEVVCTRKTPEEDPDLYQRAQMARGCGALLSLHSNAVGSTQNDTVDYVKVFHPISGAAEPLARELAEVIANVMGTRQQPQTGSRVNSAGNADYYGVIRHAAALGVPGLILEHSFHTQGRATAWLLEDDNLRRLAEAEAAVIAEYFGMEEPEMRYELLKDVKNDHYRPTLEKLVELGLLQGRGGQGEDTVLQLGEDAVRLLVILDRAGLFDGK